MAANWRGTGSGGGKAAPFICAVFLLTAPCEAGDAAPGWRQLDEGLHLGRFKADHPSPTGDSIITVVRANPVYYELKLLSVGNALDKTPRTVKEWCEEHDLAAATNAGMFDIDLTTHIGYMKSGDYVNNPKVITKDYRSAAAFGPVHDSLPQFRIFDLDETPMESVVAGYRQVVQNIRLIKRPGENRWPEREQRWSEAALGEDADGNILFVFSRSPYTMHDFIEILLSLPLNIVCAQHLEGGPEAQLVLRSETDTLDLCGSYESAFFETDANAVFWPVPNVIGVKALRPTGEE